MHVTVPHTTAVCLPLNAHSTQHTGLKACHAWAPLLRLQHCRAQQPGSVYPRVQVVEAQMRRRRELDKQQDAKDDLRMQEQQEGRRVGDAGYRCPPPPHVASCAR